MAPIRQVVHVLQKLFPGHHARGRVGGHEVWAARALRVGAHLLAHVLADARELVLHLGAVLQVLRGARLAVLGDLEVLRVRYHRLLERRSLLGPGLQLLMAPIRQVVHVLQKLFPGHHARGRVGGHEVWAARALRVGAHLLAHVLADARELVLQRYPVLKVLSGARLAALDGLHVEHRCSGRGRQDNNQSGVPHHWSWV